jgi:hypothetical protein
MQVADQPFTRAVCAQSYTKIRKNSVISVCWTGTSPTSASGQSRHFGRLPITSGLPLETDIVRVGRHI